LNTRTRSSAQRTQTVNADGAQAETADYYEVLQVSRNAHPLIIAKVYRLLVAFYHPDKPDTGNKNAFLRVVEAYRVLSDPVRRTTYDRRMFGAARPDRVESGDEALRSSRGAGPAIENESDLRDSLLQALYTMRRNQPQNPGLSLMTLSELLGCSIDVMQFTLWYLRGKKFIDAVDDGNVAITVHGVDHIEAKRRDSSRGHEMLAMPSYVPTELASEETSPDGGDGPPR
jgi:curved DNA-binding protein